MGFCCTDDLLSTVWLGFAGSDNVVRNHRGYTDYLLFWTYTGLFKLLPEPLSVLLESQRSETCSKGNIQASWVSVSYLETEELSGMKKLGQGSYMMKH